ncbi:MAG: AraC family transcriptional regulator [Myxococcales bacterium]|nr:MAG: AraC family transcriptional regulator [Myxococcales bacterium]
MPSPLFSFRLVPIVATMVSQAQHDALDVVRRAGLPDASLHGEVLAPLDRIQRLVDLAAECTERPQFGLDLVDLVPAGTYGYPELIVRTAPTLGDGLRLLAVYASLVNPIGRFELSVNGDLARLDYSVLGRRDGLGVHLNEYSIAFLLRSARALVGGSLVVSHAWFSHARPVPGPVAARLGCPVRFGQSTAGFGLAAAELARPLRHADPVVHRFLLTQARALLGQQAAPDAVALATLAIERRMGRESFAIDRIARDLGLTPRTLQRRLVDAGTAFSEVVQSARLRRADRLLAAGVEPPAIARQLGYDDVRSLRRALARWGRTLG